MEKKFETLYSDMTFLSKCAFFPLFFLVILVVYTKNPKDGSWTSRLSRQVIKYVGKFLIDYAYAKTKTKNNVDLIENVTLDK